VEGKPEELNKTFGNGRDENNVERLPMTLISVSVSCM
jgi:hypothetical protein